MSLLLLLMLLMLNVSLILVLLCVPCCVFLAAACSLLWSGQSELNYDEEGYLFTPPCLWGDHDAAATGGVLLLPPPILHKNTTLRMVTVFNSTYDHPGQMGIWQMKGAPVV